MSVAGFQWPLKDVKLLTKFNSDLLLFPFSDVKYVQEKHFCHILEFSSFQDFFFLLRHFGLAHFRGNGIAASQTLQPSDPTFWVVPLCQENHKACLFFVLFLFC